MEKVHFIYSDEIKEKVERVFQSEKQKIEAATGATEIEHVGGTAIPNLLTKGDIDINVQVKNEEFSSVIEALKVLYEINQPNNWNEHFASFKDDNSFELPLGVQVTVIDSPEDDFVRHREMLMHKPDLVEKYNDLKKSFEGKKMSEYREAKTKFFESISNL